MSPEGHTENPAILIWMSYVVNVTFRVVFKIHAKDITNSFRLYHTSILKAMRLQSNDFDILEEILIKAVTHRPPARVMRGASHLWPPQGRRKQAQAGAICFWLSDNAA